MWAAALLAVGVVGVHLEESADLPLAEATQVAHALIIQLTPRAGGRPVLDDPLWPACQRQDRCVTEIVARLALEELVMLRLIAGPSRIRLVAERLGPERTIRQITVNLPRDPTQWASVLADVALQLYPVPLPGPLRKTEHVVSDPPRAQPWPWVLVGVGTASLLVGSGLGLSSAEAGAQLRAEPEEALRAGRLERMHDHGLAANVLLGTGAVFAAAGLLWLALE